MSRRVFETNGHHRACATDDPLSREIKIVGLNWKRAGLPNLSFFSPEGR